MTQLFLLLMKRTIAQQSENIFGNIQAQFGSVMRVDRARIL